MAWAAVMLLAGCGAGNGSAETAAAATADPGPPQHGGHVIVGMLSEPGSLNRISASGGWPAHIVTNGLLDPVVDVDAQNRWVARLATRVPTLENGDVRRVGRGMTVDFDVHPQARWSDGVPITCSDIEFTWKTVMSKRFETGSRTGWDRIRRVVCSEAQPKHVTIEYKRPYSWYLEILRIAPMPAHDFAGKNPNQHWAEKMRVTSGPFRFKEYRRGIRLVLERNDDYWNAGAEKRPYLDTLEFRFYKDRNTLNLQLSGGDIDLINPPLEAAESEERSTFPQHHMVLTPGTAIEVFGYNTKRAPMDDVRVRAAVAHALDRKQLVEMLLREPFKAYDSMAIPAQGVLAEPAWKQYQPDRKKVANLLTSAGYKRSGAWWTKDGKTLRLEFKAPADRVLRLRAAQLLQQQLRSNGIDVDIALEDPGVFWGQSLPKRSFDLAMLGIGAPVEPDQFVNFTCNRKLRRKNTFSYCEPEVNALFEGAEAMLERKPREDMILELQRKVAADLPALPLYQHIDEVAHNPDLHGLKPNPQASLTWNVDEWWVSS